MGSLKAILFDVDGTLADTERHGHRVAFNMAFEEAGLDWHWGEDLYGELLKVTGGKQRMRYFLSDFYQGNPPEEGLDELIISLHANKNRHYQELLENGVIPLRPGVERLIHEARDQGVQLGIATTTTPGNVYSLLEATLGKESLNWFAVIAAGDMVPRLKPAPDVFVYAMEKIGLRADECVAIEDSANGVKSAVAAGLKTLVTVNGYTADDNFSGSTLVVDHLGEPGHPCSVLAGLSGGFDIIDPGILNAMLEQRQ